MDIFACSIFSLFVYFKKKLLFVYYKVFIDLLILGCEMMFYGNMIFLRYNVIVYLFLEALGAYFLMIDVLKTVLYNIKV